MEVDIFISSSSYVAASSTNEKANFISATGIHNRFQGDVCHQQGEVWESVQSRQYFCFVLLSTENSPDDIILPQWVVQLLNAASCLGLR